MRSSTFTVPFNPRSFASPGVLTTGFYDYIRAAGWLPILNFILSVCLGGCLFSQLYKLSESPSPQRIPINPCTLPNAPPYCLDVERWSTKRVFMGQLLDPRLFEFMGGYLRQLAVDLFVFCFCFFVFGLLARLGLQWNM